MGVRDTRYATIEGYVAMSSLVGECHYIGLRFCQENFTVNVRVIAQAGVIAHAGVIAPLCVIFSSLASFNSFSAQGSESSHPDTVLVPPLSVRLHAVACGLREKLGHDPCL